MANTHTHTLSLSPRLLFPLTRTWLEPPNFDEFNWRIENRMFVIQQHVCPLLCLSSIAQKRKDSECGWLKDLTHHYLSHSLLHKHTHILSLLYTLSLVHSLSLYFSDWINTCVSVFVFLALSNTGKKDLFNL